MVTFVLTESAAIVMYLAEKYDAKGLMPADLKERARAYRWSMFAVTELEQPLWRIAKHTFLYPEDKATARRHSSRQRGIYGDGGNT